VHQGVEVSLDSVLWQSDGQKLSLHQDYTYGDYRFRHDPVFHHNQLPGLPSSYYQAYIAYDHPSGFYGSLNVRAVSGDPVDYANTSSVRPYHIFGFDVGYDPPGQTWSVFLSGSNLGNAHYASTVSPGYKDATPGAVAHATPGDLFNLVGGVTVRF
jgi:iron complex outermembrane receptor protein